MTIAEALLSITVYPIPENTVELACIDREIDKDGIYDKATGESREYRLATADIYLFLSGQNSITEQEVSFSQVQAIKKNFLAIANSIYFEFDDPKFSGRRYGFIGEAYNG